ncbi:non-homologous end-joining DNA ligase [Rhizobium leguminosarum]|uniref:DNA ligase (ATP) n=1 Tax=Rhizobium leguminosarum TaxID=384 RepID=A0A7M3DTG1_RHILE|nr:non-homologous end-joining DNA ligase [Rhizobium leguminosarum]MDV4166146.1 non-homologous end-joining DNA ligase [Rhizobium leguminosarum]MDV4176672.1 non-homologous end-joining DNA ligase [Rhizobium leguminosarum]NKK04104.1 ATP-dependent DNA ligase [Rhizobium leguminosarum bv. viciae]NKK46869.1 ATP-dependent DNA ligase [Rhizobium leguminosarum bv. viciae]QIO75689.1 ATP-dependent DNA ligase [Rhizobium leguminosarum bv. trifolii]
MTRPPRSKPLLRDTEAPIRSKPRGKRNPAQPQLPFDPMPDRVEPALAQLKSHPPKGKEWSWELKWDGYRLAVHIEPQGIRILTRRGHDWTHRFPAIVEAAQTLGPATMIIDGEAVVLDEEGRPDFGLLQQSLGASGKQAGNRASEAFFYAFDLIYFDGHDLRGVEYRSRRHLLEDSLNGPKGDKDGAIRLSETFDTEPAVLLEHVCRLGLEGIVGKHLDRPYRSGRTADWVKVKCVQSEAFFIVGYERSASPAGFGSLVLAANRGADLVHVGSVGTGFKEAEAIRLRKMLDKLRWKRKQPPLPYSASADIVWVEPTLIAEIEFRAWTSDGKLRHPSYKGLRERQDNADVFRLD